MSIRSCYALSWKQRIAINIDGDNLYMRGRRALVCGKGDYHDDIERRKGESL